MRHFISERPLLANAHQIPCFSSTRRRPGVEHLLAARASAAADIRRCLWCAAVGDGSWLPIRRGVLCRRPRFKRSTAAPFQTMWAATMQHIAFGGASPASVRRCTCRCVFSRCSAKIIEELRSVYFRPVSRSACYRLARRYLAQHCRCETCCVLCARKSYSPAKATGDRAAAGVKRACVSLIQAWRRL